MKQQPVTVFNYEHYKDYLTALSATEPAGFLSRLAEAAGCRRSYLSDVLHRQANLTPDHAFGIAEYLCLDSRASEYFMDLVNFGRAGSKSYKRHLASRLAEARRSHLNLTGRLQTARERAPDFDQGRYYSSWHFGAVHVATSVAELSSPKQLAARLHLPEKAIADALEYLVGQGLVIQSGGRYSYNLDRREPYLPEESVFSRMNHSNWRTLAMAKPLYASGDVHYSSVFTVSRRDYSTLKSDLLSFIEAQRSTIANSGADEVICFCCDLFPP